MKIERIWAVYFSATGNTERIVSYIAEGISNNLGISLEKFDFTSPSSREQALEFKPSDLVVFGVPVYAGRVPNKLLPFIQNNLTGNGALAVPVVTYGNRSIGDALIELRNELETAGLRTIAAAAIVTQHSWSDIIAPGRPDAEDLKLLSELLANITIKAKSPEPVSYPIKVIGNDPVGPYYKPLKEDGQPANFLKAKPITDMDKCDKCGICIEVCPIGSVNPDDPSDVAGICIKCHACVRKCPQGAKYFDHPEMISHMYAVANICRQRSDSLIFY